MLLFTGIFSVLLSASRANEKNAEASLPTTPIKELRDSPSLWFSNQRVKVAGTVTHTRLVGSNLSVFLQDDTEAIFAYGQTDTPVQRGELIEVVGTVERTATYSTTLRDCAFSFLGRGKPIHPQVASGDQLNSGAMDMRLVRVKGALLRDPVVRGDGQSLEIRVDQAFVSLLMMDSSASPLSQLHAGSLLQVTGVCSVGPDKQGHPAWIRIQLRSGDDVVLLRGPPWWNPERTGAALGFIVAIGLAGMGWLTMLRHRELSRALEHRVRERTAELRERTFELERVNRELESFSYTVSHDLRAPLRAMAGFGQALAEDYGGSLDSAARGYLQRITDAAAHMNRLIDGLLSLARVTRGELRRESTDLSEMATAAVEELRLANPSFTVNVTIQQEMLESVDRNLIRIVFANLLQNAWKFSRKVPDPKVEVGRLASRETLVYYVRDNGAGFDPNHSARLFQAFQRLHSAAEYEGTGIGLATVSKVVQRHGGRIWAEGQVNKGACFFFTLHTDDASPASPDEIDRPEAAVS